jgi:hypothetical protein
MKKICIATGTYKKDGQDKTIWQTVGAVFEKDNGSISIAIDPIFDLAGLYMKQCQLAEAKGSKISDRLYFQVFEDEQKQPHQQSKQPTAGRFDHIDEEIF